MVKSISLSGVVGHEESQTTSEHNPLQGIHGRFTCKVVNVIPILKRQFTIYPKVGISKFCFLFYIPFLYSKHSDL